MLTVEEALERVLAGARVTAAEELPLEHCVARVPAEFTVRAPGDVPPFANSSMDGFALRAADTPGRLPVSGEVAAGAGALPTVAPGSAVRIMTGAPLPPGTDSVVPLEEANESDGMVGVGSVRLGAWVRLAGHDTPTPVRRCVLPPSAALAGRHRRACHARGRDARGPAPAAGRDPLDR